MVEVYITQQDPFRQSPETSTERCRPKFATMTDYSSTLDDIPDLRVPWPPELPAESYQPCLASVFSGCSEDNKEKLERLVDEFRRDCARLHDRLVTAARSPSADEKDTVDGIDIMRSVASSEDELCQQVISKSESRGYTSS